MEDKCVNPVLDDTTGFTPRPGQQFTDVLNVDKKHKAQASLIMISTYKSSTAPSVDPVFSNTDQLIALTVKQATLIALNILGKVSSQIFKARGIALVTPLSGAVFAKEDMVKIAMILDIADIGVVINTVNNSCHSGGQYRILHL